MTPDRAPSDEPQWPSPGPPGPPPAGHPGPGHAPPRYPPPGYQGPEYQKPGHPGSGYPPPGYQGPGYQQPGYPSHGPYPGHPAQPAPHRTGYLRVVLATAVWGAVLVVLAIVVSGGALSAEGAGYLVGATIVPVLLGSLITWLVVRRRAMSFGVLVLAAAPAFWLLRLVASAARLSGRA